MFANCYEMHSGKHSRIFIFAVPEGQFNFRGLGFIREYSTNLYTVKIGTYTVLGFYYSIATEVRGFCYSIATEVRGLRRPRDQH